MKPLLIVSCGSKKIYDDNPSAKEIPFKDVYTGTYTKKLIEYATHTHYDFVILSAKYGFVFPDELCPGDYDVKFKPNEPESKIIKLQKQARVKGLFKYNPIISLAGKTYSNIIKRVFKNKIIKEPLHGSIGQRMQQINRMMLQ